jgi:AcrR family transcriptional regulator
MQVKKDDIKKRIMKSACNEFLRHGFQGASLRVIAEKAGLTKGAVYSYFKNKDTLFCSLTAPAVDYVENVFKEYERCCSFEASGTIFDSYEMTIESFKSCAFVVLDNHESFRLLLFCAAGSSLQEYKERMIRLYAENFNIFLSFFSRTETLSDSLISEMFIHTLATMYVGFLEEIVLHEPERSDICDYATQTAVFVHSGIKSLFFHQIK